MYYFLEIFLSSKGYRAFKERLFRFIFFGNEIVNPYTYRKIMLPLNVSSRYRNLVNILFEVISMASRG